MTVNHIRECYASARSVTQTVEVSNFAKQYAESRDYKPMAIAEDNYIPASCYALDTPAGLHFYRVKYGKKGGKWETFAFVERMIGHPGDFLYTPVKGANRMAVLKLIRIDPREAAVRFSREYTVCAVCGSPLTDPESMERGLGPICAERF